MFQKTNYEKFINFIAFTFDHQKPVTYFPKKKLVALIRITLYVECTVVDKKQKVEVNLQ